MGQYWALPRGVTTSVRRTAITAALSYYRWPDCTAPSERTISLRAYQRLYEDLPTFCEQFGVTFSTNGNEAWLHASIMQGHAECVVFLLEQETGWTSPRHGYDNFWLFHIRKFHRDNLGKAMAYFHAAFRQLHVNAELDVAALSSFS